MPWTIDGSGLISNAGALAGCFGRRACHLDVEGSAGATLVRLAVRLERGPADEELGRGPRKGVL
jgi:hypothetical protein